MSTRHSLQLGMQHEVLCHTTFVSTRQSFQHGIHVNTTLISTRYSCQHDIHYNSAYNTKSRVTRHSCQHSIHFNTTQNTKFCLTAFISNEIISITHEYTHSNSVRNKNSTMKCQINLPIPMHPYLLRALSCHDSRINSQKQSLRAPIRYLYQLQNRNKPLLFSSITHCSSIVARR